MTEHRTVAELQDWLADARVDETVTELRPDYRALLVAVSGITPAASTAASEELLTKAETAASNTLAEQPAQDVQHVAAWRDTYRAFGAKPQRTRNSLEALMRRAGTGLPRINQLTDIYNAISVLHQVPLGGEDLDAYVGAPRLVRAAGSEAFDTVADGQPVVEHPEPGEVVWCDDAGVTCRRWNWRQSPRTQLTSQTISALFILDALEPITNAALAAAADDLLDHLQQLGPDVRVATRLLVPTESKEHA
jgi:DNA/RNA-binding domain of Phe-tRNA-synthetase-like protein